MPYAALKHLHLTCVAVSGLGFFARGLLMLFDSPWLTKRWLKVAPHIVDTLLLASAVGLMWQSGLYPFVESWLTAKLLGLIAYIFLGVFALKLAPSKQLRCICFVLALFVFAWIVSVAMLKTPAGFFLVAVDRLFGTSAPSFDDPLEMLSACHERIQAQIETLHRLVPHLIEHGADAAALEAASAVLRYFTLAAPNHHADEEEDLLPALQAAGVDAEVCAHILADHIRIDGARTTLMQRLEAIIAGNATLLSADEIEAFDHIYSAHIDYEETVLLPLAKAKLAPEQLQEIGLRMAARRQSSLF